jgi:ABC-type transport system substrate-binding protein
MLLNRQQIWEGGMFRAGAPGAGPIPFDLLGLDAPRPLDSFGEYAQFNPEKAKELLKEAGVTTPLKLTLYRTLQTTQSREGAAQAVVFQWNQSGVVQVEDVIRDGQVFTQDIRNKTFPDLAFTGAGGFGYTVDSLFAATFRSDSPANFFGLNDPELDSLFDKQATATNPDEALKLARQIDDRIVDTAAHLFFGWWPSADVSRGWLRGFVVSPHNCLNGIGQGNYKYIWMGPNAPEGRGGKPI